MANEKVIKDMLSWMHQVGRKRSFDSLLRAASADALQQKVLQTVYSLP